MNMRTLKSVNSGHKQRLKINNHSNDAKIEIITDKNMHLNRFPKG